MKELAAVTIADLEDSLKIINENIRNMKAGLKELNRKKYMNIGALEIMTAKAIDIAKNNSHVSGLTENQTLSPESKIKE